MDRSIERRFVVFHQQGALTSCPYEQMPLHAKCIFAGTQQQCERYMRDIARHDKQKG